MGLLVGTTLYPVVSPSTRHKSIMWAFRIAAIPLAVVLFVVLIRNFYTSDPYAGTYAWVNKPALGALTFYSLFWLSLLVLHTYFFEQSL